MKKAEKDKKWKDLLLLFSLVFYCSALVFVFKGQNQNYVVSDDLRSSTSSYTANLDYVRVEGVEERDIEKAIEQEMTSEDFDKDDEDVLGFSTLSCDINLGIEEPQLFCELEGLSGGDSYYDIEVSEGVDIQIAEIYAPAALFAGSRAPYDNLVQINNPDSRVAFRNANEIIDPEFEFLMRQPPLEEFVSADHLSGGVDMQTGETGLDQDDFGMHAKPSGLVDDYSKIPFDLHVEAEQSVCPEVVNDGRFNVVKSNDIGRDLSYQVTPPGHMDFEEKRENTEFCNESPKNIIELSKENSVLLCTESFWNKVFHTFKGVFTSPITDEEGNLIGKNKTWNLEGILIDAPFGSANECNEESCSIRYLEAARLRTSAPHHADKLYPSFVPPEERDEDYLVADPFFLTTPCQVRVDHRLHNTRCYWDLSAWQHHFKLEEVFTYPGFEHKMEEEDYWAAVEAELKGTGWYAPDTDHNGGGTIEDFPDESWLEYLREELSKRTNLLGSSPVDAQEFFGKDTPTVDDWANLMVSMAYLESGHNPNTTYQENFKNQYGEYVISTGLFQISYASAAGYGYTVTTEQLKDPYLNIEIATVILETLVTQDNRIAGGALQGASRYWAVLRQPKVNDIKDALK